jgi:hypothetical protein
MRGLSALDHIARHHGCDICRLDDTEIRSEALGSRVEQLQAKLDADPSKEALVAGVADMGLEGAAELGDALHNQGIRSMPQLMITLSGGPEERAELSEGLSRQGLRLKLVRRGVSGKGGPACASPLHPGCRCQLHSRVWRALSVVGMPCVRLRRCSHHSIRCHLTLGVMVRRTMCRATGALLGCGGEPGVSILESVHID